MGKTVMAALSILVGAVWLLAQSPESAKVSLFASAGYGFGIGGLKSVGNQDFTSRTRNADNRVIDKEDHYLNYGRGLKASAGLSFLLMENVTAQALVGYTAGLPSLEVVNIARNNERRAATYSLNVLGVKATVTPAFRVFGLLDVRTGVGIGVYFAGVTADYSWSAVQGDIKTRPAVGFVGLAGIDFPVARRLILFGDLGFEAMRFRVKSVRDDENDRHYFEEDDPSDNVGTPDKIPGSNLSLAVGLRFPIK